MREVWCGRCEGHKAGRRDFGSSVRMNEAREVQQQTRHVCITINLHCVYF